MTAATQQEQTALTLPQRAAVALGESANMAKLRELAAQSAGIITVTNDDGRAEAHRAAMVLRTTRTNITNTGKAAREDATAFSKAVIALEKELIAVIEPEEQRVLTLRDAFDAQVEAEKQAKIAAERARVEAIQSDIASIRDTALGAAGRTAAEIAIAIDVLEETEASEVRFAEYAEDAAKVIADTMEKLSELHVKAVAAEQAAAAAEAARLAEVARMETERAELARLREEQAERERLAKVESDRIAAEQAAEAKRLADLKAAQEAEQARVAAESKRQLEAQQAAIAEQSRKLAEQQAAADARDAAARAAAEDAIRREDDHGPALLMNTEFDAAREVERVRLQGLADQAAADHVETVADERKCGLPAGALHALADHLDDIGLFPDDSEIVSEIHAMFMTQWGMDRDQADARMSRFDWAKAVAA